MDTSLQTQSYQKRFKLRGYKGPVTVFQAVNFRDAANILILANPDWSKNDHAKLAETHAKQFNQHRIKWSEMANVAAMETFGRPYQITDYRISAIACDEFSMEMKEQLRTHAHASSKHLTLANAHAAAANSRLIK